MAREDVYSKVAVVWEKIYDPSSGYYYYYNVESGVSQWNCPLRWRDIQRVAPTFTKHQAALLIQCAWHRFVAVRSVKRRGASVIAKCFDDQGNAYYYNSRTGISTWEKPWMFDETDDDNSSSSETSSSSSFSDEDSDEDEDPVSVREYPRSRAQLLVDNAEDDKSTTSLNLKGIGLTHLTYRIFCVETLTHLDVSENRLALLSGDVSALSRLEVLDISSNCLKALPKELEDLQCLKLLDVSHNCVASFPPNLYKILSLRDWNLSENQLDDLPVTVGDVDLLKETKVWEVGLGMLSNLTRLHVSQNKLARWPPQLDTLFDSLVDLDLSHNQLRNIEAASSLVNLRLLNVSHNLLDELCDDLEKLTALEILDARSNKITQLPSPSLKKLVSLRAMPLDDNCFCRIEATWWDLPKLESISLSQNSIDFVHKDLGRAAVKVVDIDLSRNKLKTIPKSISKLGSLTRLSLSHNELATLPSLAGLFRLETLLLASNLFKKALPRKFLVALVSLTVLDVSDNMLTELPKELCNLSKLTFLDASSNHLEQAFCGLAPPSLQTLRLGRNRLATDAVQRISAPELHTLTLEHNRLETMPVGISRRSPKLVALNIDHNPFLKHIVDVLEPLAAFRKRTRHFRICLRDLDGAGSVEASDLVVSLRSEAQMRNFGGAGTERLERGEYERAIEPLDQCTHIFESVLFPDVANANTASHHFCLGAALLGHIRACDASSSSEGEGNAKVEEKGNGMNRDALLLRAREAFDMAERIVHQAKLTDPYTEVYYCRAVAAHLAKDYPTAIRDAGIVLGKRPHHMPTALLRVEARCELGQFPQAQRECLKARRYLDESAAAAATPEDDVSIRSSAYLEELDSLQARAESGIASLERVGCIDPALERSFEVTPEGLLLRRKSETTTARAQQLRDSEEEQRIADEEERSYCRSLADKVRADLIRRQARYAEEIEAERAEREAKAKNEREEAERLAKELEERCRLEELERMRAEDRSIKTAKRHRKQSASSEEDEATKAAREEQELIALQNTRKGRRRRR